MLPATTAARELSEQTTDRLIALLGWAQASSPEMSRFWMEWIVAEADTLLCRGAITEAQYLRVDDAERRLRSSGG